MFNGSKLFTPISGIPAAKAGKQPSNSFRKHLFSLGLDRLQVCSQGAGQSNIKMRSNIIRFGSAYLEEYNFLMYAGLKLILN